MRSSMISLDSERSSNSSMSLAVSWPGLADAVYGYGVSDLADIESDDWFYMKLKALPGAAFVVWPVVVCDMFWLSMLNKSLPPAGVLLV